MMSQLTLSAAAGGVADAEGVGVVQALGLAEADAVVVERRHGGAASRVGETVGVVDGVTVATAVGVAVARQSAWR